MDVTLSTSSFLTSIELFDTKDDENTLKPFIYEVPSYVTWIYGVLYTLGVFGLAGYLYHKKQYEEFNKIKFAKDLWEQKGIYLHVLAHTYDTATDIGVLVQWGILAFDDIDYKGINMKVMFFAALFPHIIYRIFLCSCENGIIYADQEVARATQGQQTKFKWRQRFFAILDITIFQTIYETIKNEKEQVEIHQKYLHYLESVFESAPQVMFQLIFLIKSYSDPYLKDNTNISLVIASLIFSALSITARHLWIDSLPISPSKSEPYPQCKWPCINIWYLIRVLWRCSNLISRGIAIVLIWTQFGGVVWSISMICFILYALISAQYTFLSNQLYGLLNQVYGLSITLDHYKRLLSKTQIEDNNDAGLRHNNISRDNNASRGSGSVGIVEKSNYEILVEEMEGKLNHHQPGLKDRFCMYMPWQVRAAKLDMIFATHIGINWKQLLFQLVQVIIIMIPATIFAYIPSTYCDIECVNSNIHIPFCGVPLTERLAANNPWIKGCIYFVWITFVIDIVLYLILSKYALKNYLFGNLSDDQRRKMEQMHYAAVGPARHPVAEWVKYTETTLSQSTNLIQPQLQVQNGIIMNNCSQQNPLLSNGTNDCEKEMKEKEMEEKEFEETKIQSMQHNVELTKSEILDGTQL